MEQYDMLQLTDTLKKNFPLPPLPLEQQYENTNSTDDIYTMTEI